MIPSTIGLPSRVTPIPSSANVIACLRAASARSERSATAATSPIRTTQSAIAVPTLSAPGLPRKRKIATGTVGQSARTTKTVAPNSPERDGEREPGGDGQRAREQRKLDLAAHLGRRRSQHGGRLAQADVDRAEGRNERADDERQRDERLREGDDRR